MTSLTIEINPYIVVNYNNVVRGIIFSDMTTIGSSSLLANKYSVSGANELCLLNVTTLPNKKMILYGAISRTTDTCFIPLTVGRRIRTIKNVEYLLKKRIDKVIIK